MPFQRNCIRQVETRCKGRALLALDMGLGKTFTTALYMYRGGLHRLGVVVCPASIKHHWEQTLGRFGITVMVAEGRAPVRGKIPVRKGVVIINWDILSGWAKKIKALKPDILVLDECQMTANSNTKRSRAALAVSRGIPRIIALSGTPLLNRPMELYPTMHILQPAAFNSKFEFGMRFCAPQSTPWGMKFTGASNTKKLNKLLRQNGMIRIRKCDVLEDLPEKIRKTILLELRDREQYEHADEDFLGWLSGLSQDKAERADNAPAFSKIGYMLRLTAKLKLRATVEWINHFLEQAPDEKLVVFAQHRKMLRALARRCTEPSMTIDGGTTQPQRTAIVDRFQKDRGFRLLLGNLRAAGVGLTLTASSNVAIVELPWRPGDVLQAEDRCHRIGTKSTVWCWYLVARDTVEERLCKLLQKKQRVLSQVLDGGKVRGDLNVYDLLLREEMKRTQ